MSNLDITFNGKKYKISAARDLFKPIIADILEGRLKDIHSPIFDSIDDNTRLRNMVQAARMLESALNEYERSTLSDLKKGVPGFRSDYWRAFIRDSATKFNSKGIAIDGKGRFTVRYTITIWNMQKPYTYKLKIASGGYDITHGKLYKNGQMLITDDMLYKMTGKPVSMYPGMKNGHQRLALGEQVKEDGKVVVRSMDTARYLSTSKAPLVYDQRYARDKSGDMRKIGNRASDSSTANRIGGSSFHSIGNMAAVRLASGTGKVVPVNAKRIVFYTSKPIRRVDNKGKATSGRPYRSDVSGWIFLTKRNYYGKGYDEYKSNIYSILSQFGEHWLDNSSWFSGMTSEFETMLKKKNNNHRQINK